MSSDPNPRKRNKTRPPRSSRSVEKKATVSQVSRMIARSERRHFAPRFFTAGAAPTLATATVLASITDIAQGNTDSNRDADSLTMTRLHLKYNWSSIVTNTNAEILWRFFIIQWYPDTANLAPTATQLFLNDPVLSAISPRSFWSHDHLTRKEPQFRVLYDKLWHPNGPGTLAFNPTMGGVVDTTVNIQRARKEIQFSSGSTDGMGKLFVGVISSTSTTVPTITYNTLLEYVSG